MPTPGIDAAVESVWPSLEKSLKTGLDDKKNPQLGDVVPLVTRDPDLIAHIELAWTPDQQQSRLRTQQLTGTVRDIYELRVVEMVEQFLNRPNPGTSLVESMTSLGTEARTLEYYWVIARIIESADFLEVLNRDTVERLTGDGRIWRVVAFEQKEEIAKDLKSISNVEVVGSRKTHGSEVAVLFPLGATAVSRLEDFTPTVEIDGPNILVSLTARLKLLQIVDPDRRQHNREWFTKSFGSFVPTLTPVESASNSESG